MSDPIFFTRAASPTLTEICAWTGAKLTLEGDAAALVSARRIEGVAALDRAGPRDLVFLDNPRYAPDLAKTRAAACLVAARNAGKTPLGTVALVTPDPYRAFATVTARLYPQAIRPQSIYATQGLSETCSVHPDARLEAGVTIDPGAVVGQGAEIGSGTIIGANAVIGDNVRIGRDCAIGPGATILHALIGNRVIIHGGARVGQDGFGFAMGPRGHLKVPQIGRVIVQDDVEIGANSTIDRGANRDTVIGEGTKIDNLVQIAHNVVIGRHCVIVAQVGISGSTTLDDYVVLGGQAGLTGHLKLGMGAQLAAQSGLMNDMPPGARWAGNPAKPGKAHFREVATLAKLAGRDKRIGDKGSGEED
jgi:UDP-3-O-[3-hydroxymyristoyl] glucosamine N-acyltransferase